jgi:ADP-heptose:LPS heptosyltransferase
MQFIPWDARVIRLAARLRRPVVDLGYASYDAANDRDAPLPGHAIATLCRQLGLHGAIELKPHVELTEEERTEGRRFDRQVVVQSSAAGALIPVSLKTWPQDRWAQVVAALAGDGYQVIQLGSTREPALAGAHDLRGRTTVREAAAVLAHSKLFVGLVGGLMHLARAVDCPAVIVYGGREDPVLAGYAANTNLVNRPPCSPCYFRNHCPHELICMEAVGADDVVAAARERLARSGEPLVLETIEIP